MAQLDDLTVHFKLARKSARLLARVEESGILIRILGKIVAMEERLNKLVTGDELRAVTGNVIERLAILETLMSQVDDKITELGGVVAAQGTVIESAITLMDGLFDQLMAAIADNSGNSTAQVAAIQAVIDAATAQKDALAAKVVENTPAATGA